MSAKNEKVDPEWPHAPEVNAIYDALDESQFLKMDLIEDAMSGSPADFVFVMKRNLEEALGEIAKLNELVGKVKVK